jgi:hypothetical protein
MQTALDDSTGERTLSANLAQRPELVAPTYYTCAVATNNSSNPTLSVAALNLSKSVQELFCTNGGKQEQLEIYVYDVSRGIWLGNRAAQNIPSWLRWPPPKFNPVPFGGGNDGLIFLSPGQDHTSIYDLGSRFGPFRPGRYALYINVAGAGGPCASCLFDVARAD